MADTKSHVISCYRFAEMMFWGLKKPLNIIFTIYKDGRFEIINRLSDKKSNIFASTFFKNLKGNLNNKNRHLNDIKKFLSVKDSLKPHPLMLLLKKVGEITFLYNPESKNIRLDDVIEIFTVGGTNSRNLSMTINGKLSSVYDLPCYITNDPKHLLSCRQWMNQYGLHRLTCDETGETLPAYQFLEKDEWYKDGCQHREDIDKTNPNAILPALYNINTNEKNYYLNGIEVEKEYPFNPVIKVQVGKRFPLPRSVDFEDCITCNIPKDDNCSICNDVYEIEGQVRKPIITLHGLDSKIQHIFHLDCIIKYIITNENAKELWTMERRVKCPLCREVIDVEVIENV